MLHRGELLSPQGPDQDFAQGPVFVQGSAGALVFAGNKSGMGYALNPDTGALIWSTQPGMGMMWGSATDNKRIYVANRVSLDGELGHGRRLIRSLGRFFGQLAILGGQKV